MSKFILKTSENNKELESVVPQISYPPEFKELSSEHRIKYMEKLSSSLNFALDMMQKERNEGLEKISQQEAIIKNLQVTINNNNSLYTQQLNLANDRQQKLNDAIIVKSKTINDQNQELSELRIELTHK